MPALGAAGSVTRPLPLLALSWRRAPAVGGVRSIVRPAVRAPVSVRVRRRAMLVRLRSVHLRNMRRARTVSMLRRRRTLRMLGRRVARRRGVDLRRMRSVGTMRRRRRGGARRNRTRHLADVDGCPWRREYLHLGLVAPQPRPRTPADDRRPVDLARTHGRRCGLRRRDVRLPRMQQQQREGNSRKEGGHGDQDNRSRGDAGHSAAADQKLLLADRSQFVTPAVRPVGFRLAL